MLKCGRLGIAVSAAFLEVARPRVHAAAFVAEGDAQLAIERRHRLKHPLPLEGSLAPWGEFELDGDTVVAHIPDDAFAAESILRVAWQLATIRQGGSLLHGCAFGWGGQGFAAIGQSGAGKSTLATLATSAPGDGTLLTDEIVQLFDDGTCFGTPFRSNVECVGAPGPVKLRSLLLLNKGPHEALAPVDAATATQKLLGQLYKVAVPGVRQSQLVTPVLKAIDAVGVQQLTFRKDAAVGAFLRSRL